MQKELNIPKKYVVILLVLFAYEILNYGIHVGGWSFFNLEQLVGFRDWIEFSDIDRMAITPQYVEYADAYAEFMILGAATFPFLVLIWLVTLAKIIRLRDYSQLFLWLIVTMIFVIAFFTHTNTNWSNFFGTKWLFSQPPFWMGLLNISILRISVYYMLIYMTSN